MDYDWSWEHGRYSDSEVGFHSIFFENFDDDFFLTSVNDASGKVRWTIIHVPLRDLIAGLRVRRLVTLMGCSHGKILILNFISKNSVYKKLNLAAEVVPLCGVFRMRIYIFTSISRYIKCVPLH